MEPETVVLPPELRAEIEAARAERLRRFGWQRALWLVLLPEWSVTLARACGFPFGDEPPDDFVERAAAAGLCESREEIGRGGRPELRFWVPSLQRDELLDAVKAELGRRAVRDLASDVAERLLALGDELPPSLRHWAELAAPRESSYGGAARLSDEVRRSSDQAEALDWIAAGEGLAPLLGGELEAAVSRGKRRVNLEYRRRSDERLLSRYVERPRAEAALRSLIDGPDEEWALHLIGMGGVGKTMLVRHLVGRLAPERDLAVGRVDFDHIDPRFPWERPSELLVELADALAAHVATPEQERALENFVERVRRADEARTKAIGAGLALLQTPAFAGVLASFVRFLAELGRPVVLVLDTCEELAKLHPAEGTVRSVDALFAILEALQREPAIADGRLRLRILLAGRRLLATAGAGWSYDRATQQPAALTSLAARSYLRLFEVRGFDRDEAATLLDPIDEELFAAILDVSRETGRVPGVPGASDGPGDDRFNPFDLELYAQWLAEVPELRAADVAAGGTDAYVKARIVDRLREPGVAALLPGAVLLRRFDLAMLAPVMPDDADARPRLMEALAEQEWMDLAAGETPETMIAEVEPHLLPRLERWFEGGARRSELAVARRALGPHLGRLLLERPLDALAVDCADSALRLLDDAGAESLWLALEERVAREGRWEWAAGTCERLLGHDDAGRPQHGPLRAAIGATHAAALLHRDGRVAPEVWEDVVADARSMAPGSELSEPLRRRALLGAFAAGGSTAMQNMVSPDGFAALLDMVLKSSAERRGDHGIASGVAALEAAADGPTLPAAPGRPFPVTPLLSWAEAVEHEVDRPELAAAAWLVTARLLRRARRYEEAFAAFDNAERIASGCGVRPDQRWADWLAPDSSVDRVRLEGVLLGRRPGVDDHELEWLSGARQRIDLIDAERLASALLLEILARRLAPLSLVSELTGPAHESSVQLPRCAAHERVPPLFIAVARAWAAMGRADEALELLDRRVSEGEQRRGADVAVARAAALARVELLALLRGLLAGGPELPGPEGRWHYHAVRALREPAGPDELTEALAIAALSAVSGPPPLLEPVQPVELHARWRASTSLDAELVRLIVEALRRAPAGPNALTAHLALDLVEAAAMGFQGLRAELEPAKAVELLIAELLLAQPGPAVAIEATRLALRSRALYVLQTTIDDRRPRLIAELALEEGQLLALRLPDNARRLLEEAHRLFKWVGDPIGRFCAAVAWAATEHRSGNEDRAREIISGEAKQAYEALRADGRPLPPWSDLVTGETSATGDPPLTPSVLRLAPFVQWAEGGGRPPLWSGPAAPRGEPRRPPPARTAAETPSPAAASAAMPEAAAEPEPPSRLAKRRLPLVRIALSLGVVVALLLVVSTTMLSGTPSSGPGFAPDDDSTFPVWPIAVGVAALALAAWALRRRWIRTRAPTGIRCSIRRGRPGSAVVQLHRPGRRRGEMRPFEVPVPETGARREGRGLLEVLNVERVAEGTRVALTVEPALAPVAWERMLVGTDRVPHLWRTHEAPRPPRSPAPERPAGLTPLAPDRWLLLLEDAWGTGPPVRRSVVHLIGAPALTPGGWRLRIEAGALEAPSRGTVTAASLERQDLIDPGVVGEVGCELVVVQGLPGVLDPEAADGLRGFAAAVGAAGANAVLTIPSLPPEAARSAVAALAGAMPERPLRLDRLLQLTAVVRAVIMREIPRDDALPSALDVVLFASPEKE